LDERKKLDSRVHGNDGRSQGRIGTIVPVHITAVAGDTLIGRRA
jgi:hypothetical protein